MATASKQEGVDYLTKIIGHTLRVSTTDSRMFVGEFKCTDSDRNIILAGTHEYRMPSASAKVVESNADKVVKNMTSRYLGLVVVPGEYITKIELEEFESQAMKKNATRGGERTSGVLSVAPSIMKAE